VDSSCCLAARDINGGFADDELLRQVVRGSLARLLLQLGAVRTILLDSFREQGADASGTRLLCTLTCALISSAAVTISVEREAGLFVIGLFSWCMPMGDKLDCRISRVKAAKFPQIQIKIFQQRTRRCVRARSSRPASTLTSADGRIS
jgi:hypothetical protein